MMSVEIIHYTGNKKDWTANVEDAFFRPGNELVDLKTVRLKYPEKDLKLKASDGVYDLKSGRIDLKKDIKGSIKNTEFSSATISYSPDKKVVLARDGIVIQGRKFRITGDSGKIINNNIMKVEGNVKAVFY